MAKHDNIKAKDDELTETQKELIAKVDAEAQAAEAQAKADAEAQATIAEAQAAEDEAVRVQAKADAVAKAEADATAEADAKAKAEAQALIDEQTQAVLNEEAQSVTSFALTGNLKTITLSRHEYPHKHEHQAKSTVNLDSFTGVFKKGGCLRIDQLMEHSTILNIQVWFLSKEAPKFTVGNLSDSGCYIDCSEGAMKASLKEDGGFNALQTKIQPNYRDIIIKFESDFVGKLKTQITYNV